MARRLEAGRSPKVGRGVRLVLRSRLVRTVLRLRAWRHLVAWRAAQPVRHCQAVAASWLRLVPAGPAGLVRQRVEFWHRSMARWEPARFCHAVGRPAHWLVASAVWVPWVELKSRAERGGPARLQEAGYEVMAAAGCATARPRAGPDAREVKRQAVRVGPAEAVALRQAEPGEALALRLGEPGEAAGPRDEAAARPPEAAHDAVALPGVGQAAPAARPWGVPIWVFPRDRLRHAVQRSRVPSARAMRSLRTAWS